jgi:putative membrane protein
MALIGKEDGHRIEEAISRLEQRSAAEFVFAVVPSSSKYLELRGIVAALWALAAAIAYIEFFPHAPALGAIALELPVALVAWFVTGLPPVFRRFIPRDMAVRAVEARAFQLFAERGVHHTRDRTGMLLLLSELEHRVVLLADRGVDERVGQDGWHKHVQHVIDRIHEGRAAEGVLEVLAELETLLASEVPIGAGDVNELPNTVLRVT